MKDNIIYIIANLGFVYILYCGYIIDVDGAKNVALFLSWALIFLSVFSLRDQFIKELKIKKEVSESILIGL